MYNQPLTSIDSVKHTIRTAYSEHDWLLIVLSTNGWADNYLTLNPSIEANVGIIRIGEVNIIARREAINLPTPQLNKIKVTVDFRVPTPTGEYYTIESLKTPTEEDIRAVLLRMNLYTGYNIVAPVATTL